MILIDPENVKFQYLFDSLKRISSTLKRKNFFNNLKKPKLILQRNDVIAKRVEGNSMVAPCKSERPTIENIEFKGGLIRKFEIERINAELETLAHNYETINPKLHQIKDEFFWQEISEEGEKLIEQMEEEFNEVILPIKEEFEDVIIHWKLISICVIL
uniref:Uncharacterized protein n=1 Tax=Wuchereria bancrofti TaxID=6293 RepID=A0A1I8EXG3_WUCBA